MTSLEARRAALRTEIRAALAQYTMPLSVYELVDHLRRDRAFTRSALVEMSREGEVETVPDPDNSQRVLYRLAGQKEITL